MSTSSERPSPYELPADDEIEWVSKSEMKREAQRTEALAEQLIGLSQSRLQSLELPSPVVQAVREARRLTKPDAVRRQTRHVSRLLQKLDLDLLSSRLALFDPDSDTFRQINQLAERWRDDLLQDSAALTRFLEDYPEVDRQALRQLIMNTQRELKKQPAEAPPSPTLQKNRKRLLQTLRTAITEQFPG
ncbi:DUF615 domain-containing protein [Natronospirillum operosum]|uniref:Dual-action ribosomal maturation protein DarP n=1 Tax=Natronospirillum operosum TaxID=2759953 RepID=A0A4Z0W2V6_9GAMM|nr:ribosome biogenesis factor YjgA [Natronospirillum operosum]TGG90752.1 DUF615 domain-containing protein [Natronospirillum operosum]